MNQLNTNHQLELEVLTPVHIGAGKEKDWIKGLDFIHQSGKIMLLDKNAIFSDLDASKMSRLLGPLENNNYRGIVEFLEKYFDWNDIVTQTFTFDNPPTEIKPLIRNGNGKPYIPGSSIKGAIRSVLFQYLYKNVDPGRSETYIEQDLLGNFDRSLSRYLRPSDAETSTAHPSAILQVDVFNLYSEHNGWEGDWANDLKITAEHFRSETRFNFRFSIADGVLQFVKEQEHRRGEKLTPTYSSQTIEKNALGFLFKIINAHTIDFLTKEIEFFDTFDKQYIVEEVIQELRRLREIAKQSDQQCVLRLGAGSGFHSITGDWRFPNHLVTIDQPDEKNRTYSRSARQRVPARYKSRKIIPLYHTVPGFVLLRPVGERLPLPAAKKLDEKTAAPAFTAQQGEPAKQPVAEQQPVLQKSKVERKDIPLEAIQDGTVFTAQVVEIVTSVYRVMLFITGRNDYAQMTLGVYKKSVILDVNDIVKVKVATRNKEGRIVQVAYVP